MNKSYKSLRNAKELKIAKARNPRSRKATLRLLASDSDWRVRMNVAANPGTPVDTLSTLANDEPAILIELANNTSTSPETLKFLASQVSPEHAKTHGSWVLNNIATNPSAPLELSLAIALEANRQDSITIAGESTTDPKVLEALRVKGVLSSDTGILYAIALNPSAAPETLEKLAATFVFDSYLLNLISQNPNASDKAFEICIKPRSHRTSIKRTIAKNSGASEAILVKLANDGSPSVRAAVATNPNIPLKTFIKLTKDSDPTVASKAFGNTVLEEKIREKAIREGVVSATYEAPLEWLLIVYEG